MFEGAGLKTERFATHHWRVALEKGCEFLDTGKVIVSSDLDGIDFEADEHAKLGGGLWSLSSKRSSDG